MSTSIDSRPSASPAARNDAAVPARRSPPVPNSARADGFVRRTLGEFGVQDYWVLTYCVALVVAALQGVPGPDRAVCIQQTGLMLTFATVGIVLVRSRVIESMPLINGLLYRLSISGVVQISYFFFRRLLPVANPGTLDHELYALDLALFGVEPAMALDGFVSPFTTEWFAFFYFGYFPMIGAHILPIVLFARQKQLLGEFTFGLLTVFCIGHVTYMLVPGFGPFHAMAGEFENQFPPGLWHDLVMNAVSSGGAFKDIFPSIHTATPTFIALFSFRHRHRMPFRYTWLPVTLFALNIIFATMFLRWHYLIDVVAGLALGSFALWLTVRVTRYELSRRAALGLSDSWPEMVPDLPAEQLDESRPGFPHTA